MTITPAGTEAHAVGTRLARAVAQRDAAALQELFAPTVSFAALTPRGACREDTAGGAAKTIVELCRAPVDIRAVECVPVSSMLETHAVDYVLQLDTPMGPERLVQRVLFELSDERITWLRLICTGLRQSQAGDAVDGATCAVPDRGSRPRRDLGQ